MLKKVNAPARWRTALVLGSLLWALATSPLTGQDLAVAEGNSAHLALSPRSAQTHPWLIVGPVTRAWKLSLVLTGATGRQTVELPVVAGQPTTWSIPLDRGTRAADLVGAWLARGVPLHLAEGPSHQAPVSIEVQRSGLVTDGFRITLPAWRTAAGFTPLLRLGVATSGPWTVEVADGASQRRFGVAAGVTTWDYAQQAWGVAPRRLDIQSFGQPLALLDLQPTGVADGRPLPADTATMLAWPTEAWRTADHEWFAWSAEPRVLVLITRTYDDQDAWFKRLAFFVEKSGHRGALLGNDRLASLHGWNAHDYQASDLAEFFTKALQQGFALTPQERALREELVASGIIVASGNNAWVAGEGAVLGVSAESPPALRALLLTHESFHGLYFTNAEFRQATRDLWNQLGDGARTAVRSFLAPSQYDTTFDPLVINEFQAYLLQQPLRDTPAYLAGRLVAKAPLSAQDKALALAELVSAAGVLGDTVQRLFGVSPGDVRTVRP